MLIRYENLTVTDGGELFPGKDQAQKTMYDAVVGGEHGAVCAVFKQDVVALMSEIVEVNGA